ncbi:hypothetical protein [Vibrio viridaestus]|uniref:50S ribosomal protein L33 n=1 Tax=Vibrio viridaestus TaxID=2487322 RepID=A0A3N9TC15_9VIBR|nr:hypothetical protein [Vibrio viridaestus]RQW61737.1 hypothetical protein EES38_17910 [Vibrio viridaestus]
MRYNRRKWNNILILSIIFFIVILNLPTLIKTYLIPPDQQASTHLFRPDYTVKAVYSSNWALEKKASQWSLEPRLAISAEELFHRWSQIQGTIVDSDTYNALVSRLPAPESVEVWYQQQEEPQRITLYQLPQFWLFKNWRGDWIAVSVDKDYLFPKKND